MCLIFFFLLKLNSRQMARTMNYICKNWITYQRICIYAHPGRRFTKLYQIMEACSFFLLYSSLPTHILQLKERKNVTELIVLSLCLFLLLACSWHYSTPDCAASFSPNPSSVVQKMLETDTMSQPGNC